ncbi:MAG: Type I restriction-modification system, R subunit, partial [Microgenomates group bacterium GW2011_GWA2_40_6]
MKFNEQYTVENYIIEFLCGDRSFAPTQDDKKQVTQDGSAGGLGYEYIPPQEFTQLREFENEYIVSPLLLAAIKRINNIDDDEAYNIVREVKKIDTNEGFLNLFRNGVDIVDLATKRTINYRVVDFDNLLNNQFVVSNQFYFEGNSENIRPDILVFLNGLPVVDIEAKSPTASVSVNYENAVDQIGRYERNAWKLFLPNCFNVATDGLKTVYGVTYSPKQYFAE